jgi:hypothetical protein
MPETKKDAAKVSEPNPRTVWRYVYNTGALIGRGAERFRKAGELCNDIDNTSGFTFVIYDLWFKRL